MRVFTVPGMKGLRQQGPVLLPATPWTQMRLYAQPRFSLF